MKALFPSSFLAGAFLVVLFLLGGAAPSNGQVIVRSSLSQEESATPGDTYQRAIELYNQGDRVRTAEVSIRDYLFNHEGESQYTEPGSHERSNAPWVDYGSSTVTIPPGEETQIDYDVQVPDTIEGEAPSGTYWSIIIVEPLDQNPDADPQDGVAVQQVRRYGIQVVTHIGDTGSPNVEVLSRDIVSQDDRTLFRLALENTGTRSARAGVRLEMYDETGELAVEQSSSPKRIYPNTSVSHQLDLSELSSGEYQALLVLQSDSGTPTGMQFSIEL